MIRKIEQWFHHHYDFIGGKAISAFRILFAFFLLFTGTRTFASIDEVPTTLYRPKKNLAKWFDLPDIEFFIALDYLLLIALVFLLFGFKTKWSSVVIGIVLIVGQSFDFSFGKISHGLLFVTFIPLVMAFSNWGRYYSVDEKLGERRSVRKWPLTLMSFIVGFGMMTAGLQKLRGGWLNPDFQAIKFQIFKSHLNLREGILTDLFLSIKSVFFWELMDYLIIIFEIGFLIAIANYKWFRGWVIAALCFHVGVFFILDITFSKNVIAYFLFLDWVVIMSVLRFENFLDRINVIFNWQGLIVGLVVFLAMKIFLGTPYFAHHLGIGRTINSLLMFFVAFFVVGVSWLFYFKRKSTT